MTNQDLITKLKAAGYFFVNPGYKDQEALDRELEPMRDEIRKRMYEAEKDKVNCARFKLIKKRNPNPSNYQNKPKYL